ncbi:MAG: NFACT family protein [Bacteroidota bacterium]
MENIFWDLSYMVTHYFTLHALSKELDEHLREGLILEVYTQHKNELLLTILRESREMCLTISIEPALNYIYLRDTVSRARKNTVDIFPDVLQNRITGVTLHPHDRIMQIQLERDLTIQAHMYNTSASNIILIRKQGIVEDAFKHGKDVKGKVLTAPVSSDSRFPGNPSDLTILLHRFPSESIFACLKTALPLLGSTIAREVLHRSRIDEKQKMIECTPVDIERLARCLEVIHNELEHPHPTIYYRSDVPKILSVIPLHHLAGSRTESFPDVNQAVHAFVAQSFRHQRIDSEKNRLLKHVQKILKDSRRSAELVNRELVDSDRANEYEHIGNVIMANLQHLTKGTKEIDVPDVFDAERPLHIAFDPKLTPVQNAARYFEKAKKSKLAHVENEKRLKELTDKMSRLETLLLHLDNCQTMEQVNEFKTQHEQGLRALGIIKREDGKELLPFRVFVVDGGFEVWVGKSAANNDLLTAHYAKPNDLWFHARGASGSHTVLKSQTKTLPPPKAIRQAASIAAYYSKMRKASNVAVAYCERKYVRKPRKSAEGAVLLEREKVIFVEPGLP